MIAADQLGLPSLAALLMLSACAAAPATPTGPTVAVLPGNGKSFDQFRADDAACQQYARTEAGGTTPDQAGARQASADKQRRYDLSYIQCMYAKDQCRCSATWQCARRNLRSRPRPRRRVS